MLVVAISCRGFRHFTWIQLFTLLTLLSLPLAIERIRTGDAASHAGAMKGLFIGGVVVAGSSRRCRDDCSATCCA